MIMLGRTKFQSCRSSSRRLMVCPSTWNEAFRTKCFTGPPWLWQWEGPSTAWSPSTWPRSPETNEFAWGGLVHFVAQTLWILTFHVFHLDSLLNILQTKEKIRIHCFGLSYGVQMACQMSELDWQLKGNDTEPSLNCASAPDFPGDSEWKLLELTRGQQCSGPPGLRQRLSRKHRSLLGCRYDWGRKTKARGQVGEMRAWVSHPGDCSTLQKNVKLFASCLYLLSSWLQRVVCLAQTLGKCVFVLSWEEHLSVLHFRQLYQEFSFNNAVALSYDLLDCGINTWIKKKKGYAGMGSSEYFKSSHLDCFRNSWCGCVFSLKLECLPK